MKLKLTKSQLDVVAKYLGDISKLVFAAAVLGFLMPLGETHVTVTAFIMGTIVTVATFAFSVQLTR